MDSPLRELLILRHAKSDHADPTLADFDRPLAERGREDAHKMGEWMASEQLIPNHIITSPAKRTLQTIKRVRTHLDPNGDIPCVQEPGIYEAGVSSLLDALAQAPRSAHRVLMVGHNPGLEQLMEYLCTSLHQPASVKLFPTCALAHIILPANWQTLTAGSGKLLGIWRVKEI